MDNRGTYPHMPTSPSSHSSHPRSCLLASPGSIGSSRSLQYLNTKQTPHCAIRHAIIEIFPLRYPGASLSWKVCVPRIFPTQNETSVSALTVTFLLCPARLLAFQASSSMNAAPNVPDRYDAKSKAPLFLGMPSGSRPIIRAAAIIVGIRQISITNERSLSRSLR